MDNISPKVIIQIPFNIDLSKYYSTKDKIYIKLKENYKVAQQKQWIEDRAKLFIRYGARSLMNQTDQDFTAYLICSKESESIIKNVIQQYIKLPSNINIISEEISINDLFNDTNILYNVVLDTDNMYEKSFIERLKKLKIDSNTKTIICNEGYVYDKNTDKVATISHPSPSFYAAVYRRGINENQYNIRRFEKHIKAIKYKTESLPGKNFCIITHDKNIDNEWDRIFIRWSGKILFNEEKTDFMKKWDLI